jgi:Inner membrane protein YqiJ, N-terminal
LLWSSAVTLLQFLVSGANAPFTVAGAVTLLFALLSLTGILGLLTGAGHDADHDADADADADADHDADAGHDHAGDGGGRGLGMVVLAGMGLGKIPISLLWQLFMVVFAVTGLALNSGYLAVGPPPAISLAWTVPSSVFSGYVVVALLSRLLGPVFTSKTAEATKRSALVGQLGTVISSRVTPEFGEIRVSDHTGHVVRVICRLAEGSREPAEHEQVVIVEYTDDVLYVTPFETERGASVRKPRVASEMLDEEASYDAALDKRRKTL